MTASFRSGRPLGPPLTSREGGWISLLSLGLVALVLGLVSLGLVLGHRGRTAMEKSDAAFHSGDLEEAVRWAKRAALSFIPSADHVHQAEERLRAVARGAEGEGDLALAQSAWDALRVVDEQTAYPGRGPSPAGEEARRALQRIWRTREQRMATTEIR